MSTVAHYQRNPEQVTAYNKRNYAANRDAILASRRLNGLGVGIATVLSDPDPDGGFPVGAELQHVPTMLRLGVFTVGSVLGMEGACWLVAQKGERQVLNLMKGTP